MRDALRTLGALLADRGQAYEIVAVGGGGLLLLNMISRPTEDLDAIAIVVGGQLQTAKPLPAPLAEAVDEVGQLLELENRWLNDGPTSQLQFGLPDGFFERTIVQTFGGLTVRIASRFDLICMKLYAAADGAPNSKHVLDLIEIRASRDELERAAPWVKEQDGSPIFQEFVDAVIAHVEKALG